MQRNERNILARAEVVCSESGQEQRGRGAIAGGGELLQRRVFLLGFERWIGVGTAGEVGADQARRERTRAQSRDRCRCRLR
jgi:hypothetical protein